MKLEDLTTIDQLTDFLSATQTVALSVISDKHACYLWIQGELVKFRYLTISRQGKGLVIRYLMKISGYRKIFDRFERLSTYSIVENERVVRRIQGRIDGHPEDHPPLPGHSGKQRLVFKLNLKKSGKGAI